MVSYKRKEVSNVCKEAKIVQIQSNYFHLYTWKKRMNIDRHNNNEVYNEQSMLDYLEFISDIYAITRYFYLY